MTSKEKIIGGVCSRIGIYFGINATFIRLLWIFLTVVTFIIPGLLVYLVLWLTAQPRIDEGKK